MAAEFMMQNVVETRSPSESSEYGYPTTALVVEAKNAGNKIHIIWGTDANDAPGALYNNAPNNSIYIPMTAAGANFEIYIKFGLKGLKNGTWVKTGALS